MIYRMLIALLLWNLMASGVYADTPNSEPHQARVVLPSTDDARVIVPLADNLQPQELMVRLLGWQDSKGTIHENLPAWLDVSYPTQLSRSAQPLLPLTLRQKALPPRGAPIVLHFRISGKKTEDTIQLLVVPAAHVVFELEAPGEILGLPAKPQRIPLKVRNKGNAEGLASLTFSDLKTSVVKARITPGSEQTVYITVPPLPQGVQELELTLEGSAQPLTRTIRVVGPQRKQVTGFGLATSLGTEGQLAPGDVNATAAGKATLAAEGYPSRFTYVKTRVVEDSAQKNPKAEVTLRYRDTLLEFQEASQSNPTGNVGQGLYLSHSFRYLPVVETLSFGVALPTDSVTAGDPFSLVRLGAGIYSRYLQADLSLSTVGTDPLFGLKGNIDRFTAAIRYSPERSSLWDARASYAAAPFSVNLGADQNGDNLRYWAESRLGQEVPHFGKYDFGVRAEFHSAPSGLPAAGDQGSFFDKLTSRLEGSYAWQVDPVAFELDGILALSGAGTSLLNLDSTVPVGPALLTAGGTLDTTGKTDLHLGGSYTALLHLGQLTASGAATVTDLFATSRLLSELGLAYADFTGWQTQLGASVPLDDPSKLSLELSLSYSQFVPTSTGFAELVDGPDPTLRKLLVRFNDGTMLRPLEGVEVRGCGSPSLTDAEGVALLSGALGTCTAVVEEASLPARSFLASTGVDLAPGEAASLTVLATGQVRGRAQYVDAETGELLEDGPERKVRVNVEGPEVRWADVTLPQGTFELGHLPIGKYVAYVSGGKRTRFTVDRSGTNFALTVPGLKRTVLDPATVTPPVTIEVDSLVAPAGTEVALRISSPAQIVSVTTRLLEVETVTEQQTPPEGDTWEVMVAVPETAAGALPVSVTVEFAGGVVAERVIQLIITPSPGG